MNKFTSLDYLTDRLLDTWWFALLVGGAAIILGGILFFYPAITFRSNF